MVLKHDFFGVGKEIRLVENKICIPNALVFVSFAMECVIISF